MDLAQELEQFIGKQVVSNSAGSGVVEKAFVVDDRIYFNIRHADGKITYDVWREATSLSSSNE